MSGALDTEVVLPDADVASAGDRVLVVGDQPRGNMLIRALAGAALHSPMILPAVVRPVGPPSEGARYRPLKQSKSWPNPQNPVLGVREAARRVRQMAKGETA